MWYARIALLGSTFFGLSIVVLHGLRPDVDPMTRAISQYAHGPYGLLMTTAFVASGVASFGLALAILRAGSSRGAAVLLGIAGVGGLLSAAFPVDADGVPDTLTGAVHQTTGLTTFIAIFVAAILVTRACWATVDWSAFRRISLVFAVLMTFEFVYVFASNAVDELGGTFGLAQRVFIGTAIVWQLLCAWRCERIGRASGSAGRVGPQRVPHAAVS